MITDIWSLDDSERKALNHDNRPKLHQNQKPIPLLKLCVSLHSDPGDLVLDPVCGSVSSLLAAAELGWDYIGIEIEAEHFKQAKRGLKIHVS